MTGLSPEQLAFMVSLMEANDRILTDADLVELERERRVADHEPDLTAVDSFPKQWAYVTSLARFILLHCSRRAGKTHGDFRGRVSRDAMIVGGGYAVMCDSLCRWGRACGNSENLGFHRTQGRARKEACNRGWWFEERPGRGVRAACPECIGLYGDRVFDYHRKVEAKS